MKYIIANWKMNPVRAEEAVKLARAVSKVKHGRNVRVVLCAPFPYLSNLKFRTSNPSLGAQDVFWENAGAYTGEISPVMLKNSGVEYVIIGHSERRQYLKETDEMVAKKVKAAVGQGLKAVLCVGETWDVRKKGGAAVRAFVKRQLAACLKNVSRLAASNLKPKTSNLFVVYEPTWAISTSAVHRACDADEAERMVRFVVSCVAGLGFKNAVGIYGGSVNGKNAGSYLSREGIDGVLPGAASLDAGKFAKIIEAAG